MYASELFALSQTDTSSLLLAFSPNQMLKQPPARVRVWLVLLVQSRLHF